MGKLVQVKFVGEKKDGNKVDLTFKGEDPTGEEQQLSDTRDAKSEVLLNLGNASAKDFDKILIAVADKHAAEEVWATAELKFPTTTKPAPSTTPKLPKPQQRTVTAPPPQPPPPQPMDRQD